MRNRSFGRWFNGSPGSAAWLCLCLYGCIAAPVEGDDNGTMVPPQTGGSAGVGGSTGGAGGAMMQTGGTGGATMTGGAGGASAGAPPATGGAPATGGVGGATGGTPAAGSGGTPMATGGTAGAVSGGSAGVGMGGDTGATAGAPPAAGTGGGGAGVGAGGTAGVSSGSGGSGGRNTDPLCKSIKSNMACANEGIMCPDLACGLADTGRRTCNCATNWSCTSCDFTNSPFATMPAMTTTCSAEADGVACTTSGAVCTGAANSEVCACYPDDEGSLVWDCDKPPWGA
jgi:hypothetical protein